jgi:beta-galactosidase
MVMKKLHSLVLFSLAAMLPLSAAPSRHTFKIGDKDFLLDGQRFQIRCGEIHAARVPAEYWRHRLKMAKAMGLNTVCAYLFWNAQEPTPGQFNWSGQSDVATFCKIAQEEGLWVILRPGPYACAEWEMGGLPWWLLKQDDIKLRTSDPHFLDAARHYFKEVGRVLGPLQITHGGPILMVQVENEYGSYGEDAAYMGELRQALLSAGFDVPLFACNPKGDLHNGFRNDLFQVVNFGSDPAGGFQALRAIQPKGPLMCGEFYPGWFDTWGVKHHTGNTDTYLRDLETMLKADASFSIYMAHGGTTFGFGTGCDKPFKPDTSSYDYDAPISEAGWVTEKFNLTRQLFSRYLLPGETIPEAPPANPVITFPATEATEVAPLFTNLPTPVRDAKPRPMEQYNQGLGCIMYRTTLPPGPAGTLSANAIHDIAQVFLGGNRIGFLDRRSGNFKIPIPARTQATQLDILVDAMGRVNFGKEVHDRKGIIGPVTITSKNDQTSEPSGWYVYNLPLDAKMLAAMKYQPAKAETARRPQFWRVRVNLDKPGDTFLDMRGWGKGMAWVNGHNLGRYWNIGPQQTMYVPGPWLKAGMNEIVVLDLLGGGKPVVAGLDKPILAELRPDLDFANQRRAAVTLHLDGQSPAHVGAFAPGSDAQSVRFSKPVSGRYFCLESLSAHDGKAFAACAELSVLDPSGKPLGASDWTIAYADSEERAQEDGSAENAIDGQTSNYWHTEWSKAVPPHPHRLIINLGSTREVGGFRYTPRQGDANVGGRIKDYRIYVGDDLVK